MRAKLLLTIAAVWAGLLTGCADNEPTDEEIQEFRNGIGDDNAGDEYPGNGDITIYWANHAGVPGCDIWDFMSTGVHDAQDPNEPLILSVVGDEIIDANGTVQCYRSGNEFVDLVNRDANDEVVFSVLGRFVFDGELILDGTWWQNVQELHQKLLHTYEGEHVYDRYSYWGHGERLVSTDVELTHASKMRKFTISSLITAECGGPGLPPAPEVAGD